MLAVVATAADWPIIGQIAWLLGHLMNFVYGALEFIGISNIGISIIIFTIIIFTAMLPLTIKQQKNMKLSAIMNPEIQKVQAKYKGKRDQASMAQQQEEMQVIYEKYGSSPVGGCLPMLLQMPVFFALWPVIQNIPSYVTSVRNVYTNISQAITAVPGWENTLQTFVDGRTELRAIATSEIGADNLYNILYRFQDSTWDALKEVMPSITDSVVTTLPQINRMNFFLGVNIGETPLSMFQAAWADMAIGGLFLAILIPVLAGLTQFLSVKLQPTQAQTQSAGQLGSSMKAMTYTMPLFSVFMGFTLPAGMGLYWAASALVRVVQQLLINAHLKKIPVETLIEKSRAKAAKKRERKGVSASALNRMAQANARSIDEKSNKPAANDGAQKNSIAGKSSNADSIASNTNAKAGSLASKANLVSRYNAGYSMKDEQVEAAVEEKVTIDTKDTDKTAEKKQQKSNKKGTKGKK